MNLKSMGSSVLHKFVDVDEETAKKESKQAAPVARAPIISPSFSASFNNPSGSPFSVPATLVLDESVYKNLFDKTNFDTTSVGKAIHKYFDALDDSGLDTETKFRMSMKQAAKLDNVSQENVLATFDSMKESLQREIANFGTAAANSEQQEITTRQQKMQDIDKQMSQLMDQKIKIAAELTNAQSSHSNATQQFNLASQKRGGEIDQQKSQFTALLSK